MTKRVTLKKCLAVFIFFHLSLAVLISLEILYQKGFFVMPDFSLLDDRHETSKLYDKNGLIIREYCTRCREIINLEDMGKFPKLAVAAEDKDFWTRNFAFSIEGGLRAVWQNIKNRKIKQGSSTITMQAARNIILPQELEDEEDAKLSGSRSNYMKAKWWRKGREILASVQMERKLSRKKILELYLNNTYCRNSIYGIEACSQYYFGKPAKKLDIAETAFIIYLWRNPRVSPFEKPREVLVGRNRVLGQLKDQKLINSETLRRLSLRQLPKTAFTNRPEYAAHFAEFVRREITRNGWLVDRGLRVYTTIDSNLQKVATDALRNSMAAMQKRNPELRDLRGTAVKLDTQTGAIRVFAQWPKFQENEYLLNQLERQTGSAFKPFQIAAMLKKGWRLSCNDEGPGPCKLDDSSRLAVGMGRGKKMHYIQNFPYQGIPRYRGSIEPIMAIGESRNAAIMSAVMGVKNSRVPKENRVNKEEIIDVAVRLGVRRPKNDPGLTVGIGSIDVSPLEMAVACAGFLGNKVTPYSIEKIDDANGIIYKAKPRPPNPILEEKVSLAITRGLRATVELPHGTATLAHRELDFEVIGKTGTATGWSGETTDNWFFGGTPSSCMAVWIGRDKKLPIKTTVDGSGQKIQETGGRNALPVFIATVKAGQQNQPKEKVSGAFHY